MAQYGEFYVSISMEELSELLPTIRSGDESAFLLADLYLMFMARTGGDNGEYVRKKGKAQCQGRHCASECAHTRGILWYRKRGFLVLQ